MISLLLAITLYAPFDGHTSQDDIILAGYENGKPSRFLASWIPGTDLNNDPLYLRSDAAEAWKSMLAAATQQGIHLEPSYAFREHHIQKRLKRRSPRLAAAPGYSPHEAGIAIDIKNCTRKIKNKRIKTEIYFWLKTHAHKYGFYQTIKNEPWHWQWFEKESTS